MIFQDFGRTEKKLLLLVLSLLFCFWLFAGSATASASGTPDPQTVTLEVAELNRLDSIFSQLSQVNGKLQNELTDSKAGAAGIEAAAAANSNAESLVRESGELIAEGQRILQTIRRRAKKDSAPH